MITPHALYFPDSSDESGVVIGQCNSQWPERQCVTDGVEQNPTTSFAVRCIVHCALGLRLKTIGAYPSAQEFLAISDSGKTLPRNTESSLPSSAGHVQARTTEQILPLPYESQERFVVVASTELRCPYPHRFFAAHQTFAFELCSWPRPQTTRPTTSFRQ